MVTLVRQRRMLLLVEHSDQNKYISMSKTGKSSRLAFPYFGSFAQYKSYSITQLQNPTYSWIDSTFSIFSTPAVSKIFGSGCDARYRTHSLQPRVTTSHCHSSSLTGYKYLSSEATTGGARMLQSNKLYADFLISTENQADIETITWRDEGLANRR